MNPSQRILAVLGNLDKLVEVANLCDQAYAEGTGHPDQYTPFGVDKPEKVAQNLAGLQAVVSGVSTINLLRGFSAEELDGNVGAILIDIVAKSLDATERGALLRLANCAWGAGQPFRTDKGPLGRATRLNIFDLLDKVEVEKDFHQIQAAAKFLMKELSL